MEHFRHIFIIIHTYIYTYIYIYVHSIILVLRKIIYIYKCQHSYDARILPGKLAKWFCSWKAMPEVLTPVSWSLALARPDVPCPTLCET